MTCVRPHPVTKAESVEPPCRPYNPHMDIDVLTRIGIHVKVFGPLLGIGLVAGWRVPPLARYSWVTRGAQMRRHLVQITDVRDADLQVNHILCRESRDRRGADVVYPNDQRAGPQKPLGSPRRGGRPRRVRRTHHRRTLPMLRSGSRLVAAKGKNAVLPQLVHCAAKESRVRLHENHIRAVPGAALFSTVCYRKDEVKVGSRKRSIRAAHQNPAVPFLTRLSY